MKWRWWPLAFPLLAASCGCGSHGAAVTPEATASGSDASVTVRVVLARLDVAAQVVDGLGRCEALPDHIATLTPAVEGHVERLLVKQGNLVKRGQPIIELDKSVAKADLAEKTATRHGLIAALTLLRSIPRPEERRANELAVDQARVALEQARVSADRLRPLVARHEVPESHLQDAERVVKQAEIHLRTAEATLHAMMIGPRPEAVSEAEGRIKTADALVDFSRAHLEFHTIGAPIDGVLDSLTCHPGQTISIGAPVGTVVDTRQVYATVWLSPHSVLSVRAGQSARVVSVDERTRGTRASASEARGLPGRVDFVGRVADSQTGNLPVRVLVDNPEGRLTIGQTVRVVATVAEQRDVVQVPAGAILDLGEGPLVGVVRDGKAVMLHPSVGTEHNGWVAISGTDLKGGEPVIVEGGYNLPEGTPVNVSAGDAVAQAEVSQ
jgi:RND family efflux transporter MFP subunit